MKLASKAGMLMILASSLALAGPINVTALLFGTETGGSLSFMIGDGSLFASASRRSSFGPFLTNIGPNAELQFPSEVSGGFTVFDDRHVFIDGMFHPNANIFFGLQLFGMPTFPVSIVPQPGRPSLLHYSGSGSVANLNAQLFIRIEEGSTVLFEDSAAGIASVSGSTDYLPGGVLSSSASYAFTSAPEPATWSLATAALGWLLLRRRRTKRP